jgi:putative endonuclease
MKIYQYYVYILTCASNTVLYVGVTNDLKRRCYEHKQRSIKGFTKKYNIDKLIYFEEFDLIGSPFSSLKNRCHPEFFHKKELIF